MIESIIVGWKIEATRAFIKLYFSVIVMFTYAFFMVQHSGSYTNLVIYTILFGYIFIQLKALQIYNDLCRIIHEAETMNEFVNTYEHFVKRKDYKKLKSTVRFVFIFAIFDSVLFLHSLVS